MDLSILAARSAFSSRLSSRRSTFLLIPTIFGRTFFVNFRIRIKYWWLCWYMGERKEEAGEERDAWTWFQEKGRG